MFILVHFNTIGVLYKFNVICQNVCSTSCFDLLNERMFFRQKEEHEKKSFLNTFRKPTKKKLSNDSQVDNFPESTITGPAYKITEILEPNSRRSAKNSNFNNLENQKSIKWRSPLVFSPGMKFSPKINHKNMFGANKAEFEYQNER